MDNLLEPFDTEALREVAEALQTQCRIQHGIEVSLEDPETNAGLVNLAANHIDALGQRVEVVEKEVAHLLNVLNFIDSPDCPDLWSALQVIRKAKGGVANG